MANELARHLRRNRTTAERRLWLKLRRLKFAGLKFRQQVPIERYIVDFACLSRRLVNEVDGATHSTIEERTRDVERQDFLEAQGFRVARITKSDVMTGIDGVMNAIVNLLNTPTPTPTPPRKGEGRTPRASNKQPRSKRRGS